MEKISEKLLLERGSPKTSKLEQIKTLNLSKLGLKQQDLPVKLLSRLRSLERWDLSGNRLKEFPKSLQLPALRCLDLSDNQMEDVTTLEGLGGLEELSMEDNLYVTVSDNYKLMVLLPKLRIYNGKDVTANANHLRFVYSDNLLTRIVAVWEKSFCLPDPVTEREMSALESSFVAAARQQVKYGPSSVSDFTRWRVEILAKEYLHCLEKPREDEESRKTTRTAKSCDGLTPAKRKHPDPETNPGVSLTPLKKLRSALPAASPQESPLRSPGVLLRSRTPAQPDGGVRMSPRKAIRPPAAPAGTETPGRRSQASREERASQQGGAKAAQLQRDAGATLLPKTQPVRLKPLHVLQCHSKQDSADDFSTQLWACAFQPPPASSDGGGGGRLVATCGGDSLCVIDCEAGMVMKKYKVPGEEFFTLAWSTVLMSRGQKASAQPCSILAAGGKRGLVKLLHPRNNVAYGEFRASRKALSILRFSRHQGNFLFVGSYDNKIGMWDIGGLDSKYNFRAVQLLTLETSSTPLQVCLPPTPPGASLLMAGEDGLFCYDTRLGAVNSSKSRSKDLEITFPKSKKEDKNGDDLTVDGLSFLSDDIVASKNCMRGCIYLWSWSRTRAQRPDRKRRAVCAVLLAELQWADTDVPYLALCTCPGRAYVACGDDEGRVWTYHVSGLESGKRIKPTEVLEWPAPLRTGRGPVDGPSINSVAADPELRYLVALSDRNMVIVWKREDGP
ncbi:leucine-rich repeat and WD repeat-containing protein 1 [Salarias fasciatus]|uniref:Origin recognition complex-associated protein n=1 Tax=Salarias fasciatus TaxID=181472 RepID=A0A672G090_SALFA|nr:leucine-rich repeat and WD repeat-containing protein 1 [Salarias fasciatus]